MSLDVSSFEVRDDIDARKHYFKPKPHPKKKRAMSVEFFSSYDDVVPVRDSILSFSNKEHSCKTEGHILLISRKLIHLTSTIATMPNIYDIFVLFL